MTIYKHKKICDPIATSPLVQWQLTSRLRLSQSILARQPLATAYTHSSIQYNYPQTPLTRLDVFDCLRSMQGWVTTRIFSHLKPLLIRRHESSSVPAAFMRVSLGRHLTASLTGASYLHARRQSYERCGQFQKAECSAAPTYVSFSGGKGAYSIWRQLAFACVGR